MSLQQADLYFVMGPTCVGKSTFLQMGAERGAGLVEVGKLLRAKYSPDYFKGQCNPEHTQQEAWDLCVSEVNKRYEEGYRIIFVDGQPRCPQHASYCCGSTFNHRRFHRYFLLLHADRDVRIKRAMKTRSGVDLETLALPRIDNDMKAYYEVLTTLASLHVCPDVILNNNDDTAENNLDWPLRLIFQRKPSPRIS